MLSGKLEHESVTMVYDIISPAWPVNTVPHNTAFCGDITP